MRRLAWVLLLAFAFAVPWEYSLDTGEPLGNIARIIWLLLMLAAIPAVLLAGRVRSPGPIQWLVLAFFLWSCCTCFWTIDPHTTLIRLRAYLQVMTPVWLVWEFADSPDHMRDLMRAYVAGSWVLAGLTIASLVSPEAAGQVRFVAQGQDPNDVARFLDLGFPMSALLLKDETRWTGKLLALGYLPIGLLGVLLTASRGGFLAALVALAGCGLMISRDHLRRLAVALVPLAAIGMAILWLVPRATLARITTIPEQLADGDLNQRLNIWQAGWQAFVHAPFFGSGAGTFVHAARLAPIDTAHNTALSIGVEGGVIALSLAAAILFLCARSVLATNGAARIALGTALLVWLVTSIVATVEESRTTWLLLAMVALAGRLASEEPQEFARSFPGAAGELA